MSWLILIRVGLTDAVFNGSGDPVLLWRGDVFVAQKPANIEESRLTARPSGEIACRYER